MCETEAGGTEMDKPNGCLVGVIGIGNLLLRDEGVGVHALQVLDGQMLAGDVRLIDGGTDPWAALSAAEGCSTLLVLDAVTVVLVRPLGVAAALSLYVPAPPGVPA
jgi:hypothetical protein